MENKEKKHKKNNNIKEENNKEKKCECNNESECACSNEDDERELLSKRIKDLEEALLRNQAELLNYKKRKDDETARIIKYAEEDILKEFGIEL